MTDKGLSCPPGYRSAVAFDKQKHRRLGIDPDAGSFAAALNVIYLTHLEVQRASLDYPVVFAAYGQNRYVPIALTGTEPGINLFVDSAGAWNEAVYCPAYVRRYPFFLARLQGEGERSVICVDETALSDRGPELINALGEPTAAWQERKALIEQMDVADRQTKDLCERLFELGLFEPFEADLHPTNQHSTKLSGLTRISARRVSELSAETLKTLVGDGTMKFIDAHLLSLQRFDRLLDLHAAGRA